MANKEGYKTMKKTISMREDVYDIAEKMADKHFGGNFSAFITFAITAYKYGLTTVINGSHPQGEEAIEELELNEEITKKSDVKVNFIDDVLGTMMNPPKLKGGK